MLILQLFNWYISINFTFKYTAMLTTGKSCNSFFLPETFLHNRENHKGTDLKPVNYVNVFSQKELICKNGKFSYHFSLNVLSLLGLSHFYRVILDFCSRIRYKRESISTLFNAPVL